MPRQFFTILLIATALLSCKKDDDTYIVTASGISDIANNDWTVSEKELEKKKGYDYQPFDVATSGVKAQVLLPAIDDSNRAVKGTVTIHISTTNTIYEAIFETEALEKKTAYAMLLNYNNQIRQIAPSTGFIVAGYSENYLSYTVSQNELISKLTNGEEKGILYIQYRINVSTRAWEARVVRQNDGRYKFVYVSQS